MTAQREKNTALVKSLARQCGFDFCGIAKAQKLDEEAVKLENWLNKGYHGAMKYMENHFDMRVDPRLLVPGAKSIITVLKNYYPTAPQKTDGPKISKYAFGEDYHLVIRKQLEQLLSDIREQLDASIQGRGFVDSAPVLERAWAIRAGLGWVGKNGNLITKQQGSFFFIATLITDLALEPDDPFSMDYCGTCRKCIDACPTEAILPNKTVDGSRCISYYTIEWKGEEFPVDMPSYKDWLFGCDVCQDVCPWNRFSTPHEEQGFVPLEMIVNFRQSEWEQLTEEMFKKIFKHSPLKRSKFKGILRNLKVLTS